jgi:hypothetical protein
MRISSFYQPFLYLNSLRLIFYMSIIKTIEDLRIALNEHNYKQLVLSIILLFLTMILILN